MADRDVTVDVVARDKTGAGIKSVERNLKRASSESNRTVTAAKKVADQWGRGFTRMGSAASRWANSGDSTGKRFVRGVGAGLSRLASLGGTVAGGLSKAVNAAGPYVQLAVAGVLVAGVIAAAPALAGAVVGGLAAGGIVGGVMLAARDARVAGALAELKSHAGDAMTQAAQPFVPATVRAVAAARGQFDRLVPYTRRIFAVSAGWLGPLTAKVGRGIEAAVAGITRAIEKAGPIVAVIGDGVELMGRVVGQAFANLADNGRGMALALKVVFALVAGAVQSVGAALNVAAETFEWFVGKIPGGKKLLDGMTSSTDGAANSARDGAFGFRQLGSGADAAAGGITRAKEAADAMVDGALGLRDAQLQAKEATLQATQTIKENGKATGDTSKKGRENERALNDMARAFNAQTAAGDASKLGAEAAAKAYEVNRDRLIAAARAAGYTKTEAAKLADTILKTPKSWTTQFQAETAAATRTVETFKKTVKSVTGKTVTLTVLVQRNGDHYIPGQGTQKKDLTGGTSWAGVAAPGDGGGRVGGPAPVSVTSNVAVLLDGAPFRTYTTRAVADADRRRSFRTRVGSR